MSRFSEFDGYDDVDSLLVMGRWIRGRQQVLNGKPGRAALKDLERALVMMPHKRLAEGTMGDGKGVCAMGAWLYRRYVDQGLTPKQAWYKVKREDRKRHNWPWESNDGERNRTITVGSRDLGITKTLAEVVSFINDEEVFATSPEGRYEQVLRLVRSYIADGTLGQAQ